MAVADQDYLYDRNGVWYYYRRVPKEFRAYEHSDLILETTGLKVAHDRKGRAAAKVVKFRNKKKEAYWHARARGESGVVEAAEFARSRNICRSADFEHRMIEDITDPVDAHNRLTASEDGLERLHAEHARQHNGGPPIDIDATNRDAIEVAAVTGIIERLTIKVSAMPEACYALMKTGLKDKSDQQVAKWKGVRKNAASKFIEAVADTDLSAITRKEMKQFRDWWKVRVDQGEVDVNTANTTMSMFVKMVTLLATENQEEWEVGEEGGLDLDVFAGFKLPKPRKKKKERPAYSNDFIQNVLLAPGAFDKPFYLHKHAKGTSRLSREAIRIYYLIVESGMSTSEIVGLETTHVFPEGGSVPGERPLPAEFSNIPYIALRPIGRELKTGNRERDIPLVGVALAAVKAQLADLTPEGVKMPDGTVAHPLFPQYFLKPNYWAQHMSAYIRQHGLKELEKQVVYCLRHSFKDRLLNSEIGEWRSDARMNSLMGHGGKTPHYGDGLALKSKHDWAEAIKFPTFPAEV